jgi:ABC-type ATPase with predicted acetyltransferase domain
MLAHNHSYCSHTENAKLSLTYANMTKQLELWKLAIDMQKEIQKKVYPKLWFHEKGNPRLVLEIQKALIHISSYN